ncbi:MAG: cytochrome c biogenesis protein CcsA [Blastocatellia bacterium]|nr:cytochrome c biogenesis protein CcsA [Blastocatellia bacterium]
MSQAVKSINTMPAAPQIGMRKTSITNYLPAILPIIGAALMVTARIKMGPTAVPNDGTLIVLAVLSYIIAAAALMTNFWTPIGLLQRIGLWTASIGFFFNLSSWLIRWVAAGDRENWIRMTNQLTGEQHFWWFFSYIPFANLYDLSIAFSFGAGFATMLIMHRENTRFIGAVSLPLMSLILLLAVFIGNSFIDLPPVLDSYWRPIHVGVASLSYGIALVSFAMAVMYLLKDGVKIEAMAVAVAGFVIVGFLGFSQSYDRLGLFKENISLGSISYRMNAVVPGPRGVFSSGGRVAVPWVGEMITLSLLLLTAAVIGFLVYLYKNNESAKRYGHLALKVSVLPLVIATVALFTQVRSMGPVGSQIGNEQLHAIGKNLLRDRAVGMPYDQIVAQAAGWMQNNRDSLVLNVQGNPVEVASLVSAAAVLLFIILFSYRTEKIRESLPALEKLDSLTYKLVGVAFAGLAILLVTGAVWANESWGRYWGWDAKETGALVAWLCYGGYLHSRIAHGWTGRRSAYFAVVGFLLVLFTYLGVSYLLPGLHSYA